jgi:hypothetical protein
MVTRVEVLLDDRALVQVSSHVVSGRADDLGAWANALAGGWFVVARKCEIGRREYPRCVDRLVGGGFVRGVERSHRRAQPERRIDAWKR